MTKALVLLLGLGTSAFAQQFTAETPTKLEGEDAKTLVRALTLANAKSTKAKTRRTWTIKLLACTTRDAKELYELPVTTCDADGRKVTGAAAAVLEDGMYKVKMPAPYNMGMKQVQAAELTCFQEERFKEEGPFGCTYKAIDRR